MQFTSFFRGNSSQERIPKGIGYFPSYEIMMDELRDYRFYEADMIHPNTTAIQYIWERFLQHGLQKTHAKPCKK